MIKINLLSADARPSRARSIGAFPWKKIGLPLGAAVGLYSVWLIGVGQVESGMLARLTAEQEKLKSDKARVGKVEASLHALQNQATVLQFLKAPQLQWAPRLNLLSDSLVGQLWFSSLAYGTPASLVQEQAGSSKKSADKKNKSSSNSKAAQKDETKKATGMPSAPEKLAPPDVPMLLLKGSAFVTADEQSSPVSRFLQKLRDHPEFKRRFRGLDLKSVEHRQINEHEISDFVIALYPTTVP